MHVSHRFFPARTGPLAAGLLALSLLMAGCAQQAARPSADPARQAGAQQALWAGRMALQVEDAQAQSFSAAFELQGSAEQGELRLFSPLGSTMARLQWQPGMALLEQGPEVRNSHSLPSLVQEMTGSTLPIAELFDWLQGQAREAPGWTVDLSRMAQGRLVAERHSPPPAASLRIALDPS